MRLKKKLGQNFLRSQRILNWIANKVKDCDSILEIGAGDGRLTKKLLALNKKVYAVEIDKQLCEKLRELEGKVILICNDFLKLKPFPVDCIVGNLPYYISSRILFKLLDWDFKRAILMFQKEFVEKMVAKPGESNYGRLSVTSQYYFNIKPLKLVKKESFIPKPKVDSFIVEITKKREKDPHFDELVRKLFSLKNKKIKKILKMDLGEFNEKRPRHLSLEEILELLEIYKSNNL